MGKFFSTLANTQAETVGYERTLHLKQRDVLGMKGSRRAPVPVDGHLFSVRFDSSSSSKVQLSSVREFSIYKELLLNRKKDDFGVLRLQD